MTHLNRLVFTSTMTILLAMTSATGASAAKDMGEWRREVVAQIAKKQSYPRSAIAAEIEGKAKVRLTVASDGAITASEIVEPTGQGVLDAEIPKLIDRLNPLPALPDGQAGFTFLLPLNWSLN